MGPIGSLSSASTAKTRSWDTPESLWPRVASVPLYHDRLVAVLPTAHPLARRSAVRWDELREEVVLVQGWEETGCRVTPVDAERIIRLEFRRRLVVPPAPVDLALLAGAYINPDLGRLEVVTRGRTPTSRGPHGRCRGGRLQPRLP